MTWLISWRLTASDERAAKPQIADQPAPYRVSGIEIGVKRELAAGAGAPEPHVEMVAVLALPQKGVVVKAQIACLQVGFAGRGLGRDDP